MTDIHDRAALDAALSTYGADLARWPRAEQTAAARRAALADPAFRRALDAEPALDALLAEARDATDRDVAAAGSLSRIRAATLARVRRDPLTDLGWRRLAAAIVVSALAGSSVNLVFAEGETMADDPPVAIAALGWPEDVGTQ